MADTSPVFTPEPVFSPDDSFLPGPGKDVVLRSFDEVDFHLHRTVLSLVSPVFQTISVVPVQEMSVLLNRALKFFYPGTLPPESMTLDELRDIIEVLVSKYDVQCVAPTAKAYLERHLATKPVAVYAIAFTHQWKDVALKAARQSLLLPLRVVSTAAPPELDHIPASCCGLCEGAKLAWYIADGSLHSVRQWFNDYLTELSSVLSETPGVDVSRDKTMFAALAAASKCAVCREKVFEQLPRFASEHLAQRIKVVIDEVSVSVCFRGIIC
ncbi:hypothetical protein FB45DRAFT_919856 [Roridomyces roridus]|uniref:BTB domain-containing protein n=1 Tax=Roridomyces roridus TaxID=1738132 RepID=A0AAD7FMU5_9AGAR|nr:hypothetical protein FB45DRAFT_919856 [Roridomyces roridus]